MLKRLLRSVTKTESREDEADPTAHASSDDTPPSLAGQSRQAEMRLSTDHLVPPEDQVLLLLAKHDGRMWQPDVVAETDYSAARVSELLTEMEANGQITRDWTDGEKLVTLPGFNAGELEH